MDIFEKNAWNDAWNKVLNRLGIRKVPGGTVNYLGNVLSAIETDLAKAGSTTADMTLYVDAATGLDTNSGLVGFPLKTIQAAIDKVPQTIKHNVTINVGAGTYAESIKICLSFLEYKNVILRGTTWSAVVPSTGPASGVFTANNGVHQFTLAAAGWTVNDLRGRMLKITSGPQSGLYYGIVSNTATTIDAGCNATAVGNSSFEIVTPATIITRDASSSSSITATVIGGALGTVGSGGLIIDGLSIGTTASRAIRFFGGSATVVNCLLSGAVGAIDSANCIGIFILNNYISSTVYLDSSNIYISDNGIYLSPGYSGIVVRNVRFLGLNQEGGNSGMLIDGGARGILCSYATCYLVNTFTSKLTIRNSSTAGIEVETGASLVMASGPGIYNLTGCAVGIKVNGKIISKATVNITGQTSDAILINSYGNSIVVPNGSSITGNTGFGIKLPVGNNVTHNNIQIGSTVTMNTNALGDLTLNGTTAISIADLRADPDKTVVDLIRLNRIAAD
jgi:hypothetical protein